MYFLTRPLKDLERETNLAAMSTLKAKKGSWNIISNCEKPETLGEISGSRTGAGCILDEPEKILSCQKTERNFRGQREEAPNCQRREKLSINRDYIRNRMIYIKWIETHEFQMTKKKPNWLPLEDVIVKTGK